VQAVIHSSSGSIERRQIAAPVDRLWSPALLLVGVLLLTIFEGAFRKWLFAGNPVLRYAAYFSKDMLFLIAAYIGSRRTTYFKMSWLPVCAALILLPSIGATLVSSNPVGAFLSLRAYLLVPACAYFAAPLIRGFCDVERFALLVAVSAVVVAMLSVRQYSLPATHFLNRYDASTEESHIIATGGHVRATGTFSFMSGMAMMAGASAWAGILLVLPLRDRALWIKAVGVASLAAGFVCSCTAMSRTGLMFWGICSLGGCLLYFRPKQIVVFVVLVLVCYALFANSADDQIESFSQSESVFGGLAHRIENADSFTERAAYVLMNLSLGVTKHPLGEGLGAGQPGGAYAAEKSMSMSEIGYESEWGRIAFEIGAIGLAAILFIRFHTLRQCWQRLSIPANDETRCVLAASLPFFAITSLGWMVFNHTGNSFAWAVMSLTLAATCDYGQRMHL
jgi:hypothetical protein